MTSYPVKLRKRAMRKVSKDAVELVEPAIDAGPFSSFRYSYTEISASAGSTRVKSRKARLEDGKLISESFEGELGRDAYDRMVNQVQQSVMKQTDLFFKSLSFLLPVTQKQRRDRD